MKEERNRGQLWVEGSNDLHVIANLWEVVKKRDPKETFLLHAAKGYKPLLKALEAILTRDQLAPVGLVVDADGDFQGRWQGLRHRLGMIGYPMPLQPVPGGLIISDDELPKLGVWIWPDNSSSGILEDFLKLLIPPDDELLRLAGQSIRKIQADGLQQFSDPQLPKALIHTWLAWQKNPGSPFGVAIKSGFLNASNNAYSAALISWLDRLFSTIPT